MVEVPPNIDNCLKFCPVFLPRGPEKTREIIRQCIENVCEGPVVIEQIADVAAYEVQSWQTSVDHMINCGTDEVDNQTSVTIDGSPVAIARVITQEELRERGKK